LVGVYRNGGLSALTAAGPAPAFGRSRIQKDAEL
jgi:hypothetical protein